MASSDAIISATHLLGARSRYPTEAEYIDRRRLTGVTVLERFAQQTPPELLRRKARAPRARPSPVTKLLEDEDWCKLER
jgi:hypothetical protein